MVSEPRSLGALDERLEAAQMLPVQRLRRAEIRRDPMLDHSITFENQVQRRERAPTVDHVILRDDLEPVHYGFFLEDVGVMRNAQTDPDPVFRESVKLIRWHMLERWGRRTTAAGPGGVLLHWRGLGA